MRPVPSTDLRLRWLLLLLIAPILALSGCSSGDSAAGKQKAGPPAPPVVVTKVERKTVPLTLQAIGNVEPIDSVAIKSRIDGEIAAVHVRDGQDVTRGQLLFELDSRALAAQLKQLEANEARDRALLANAQSLERRYADLLAKKFLSEEAYTQAKTSTEAAEAAVAADRAGIENARVLLSYTRIQSPIAGRAGRVMLPAGNTVKANDVTALVVINQLAPIYVNFSVPEQYLPQIRAFNAKGPLEVHASPQGAPDLVVSGKLAFIDNAVDPQTGTIKVRATFTNQDRQLWPGQFASVTVKLKEQPDALVIPPEAVQNGPNGQYVFVVKPDLTAEVRDIAIDRTEGQDTIVAKGLTEGETVVIVGQLRITPGEKVAPKEG
jgi:membrane fusion protein, multidrug efflux system